MEALKYPRGEFRTGLSAAFSVSQDVFCHPYSRPPATYLGSMYVARYGYELSQCVIDKIVIGIG